MLTRIRVGFALLAAVLLVPLAALISGTLETLERERELRHAAVAERVFDEAERALAEFLRQEQARPAEQYRPGGPTPLAAVPEPGFVLGYFQIDPVGRLQTPSGDAALEATLREVLPRFALEPGPAPAPASAPARLNAKPTALEPEVAGLDDGERDGRGRDANERRVADAARAREGSRSKGGTEQARAAAGPAEPSAKDAPVVSPALDAPERGADAAQKFERQAPGTTRNLQKLEILTDRAVAGSEDEALLEQMKSPQSRGLSSYDVLAELGRVAQSNRMADSEGKADVDLSKLAKLAKSAEAEAKAKQATQEGARLVLPSSSSSASAYREAAPSSEDASRLDEAGPRALVFEDDRVARALSPEVPSAGEGAMDADATPPSSADTTVALQSSAERSSSGSPRIAEIGDASPVSSLEPQAAGVPSGAGPGDSPGRERAERPGSLPADRVGQIEADTAVPSRPGEADLRAQLDRRKRQVEAEELPRQEAAPQPEPELQTAAEPPAPAAEPREDTVLRRKAIVERVTLAPSPLSGERLDATRLVLYRTAVLDGGAAWRQGMLVDLDRLGAWLQARVLGDRELSESLELEFSSFDATSLLSLPDDRFVYAHRFAEPFDALHARLAILPLYDAGGTQYIWWLIGLLAAASTLGLYALYRTAAVAVHFAERRSNFAAAVSHELKTPLTAIRMYAEMLRDGMVADEAKRREYYATLTSESERLTRLINNVLEWSKLEKHQREVTPVRGSVVGPVREVLRFVEPHAQVEGFELALTLDESLPDVRYDSDALQQILFNLIDNALKYARPSAPPSIHVACVCQDGGVAIRVRDHGPGVETRHLPLIFDAFYRVGDEMTRRSKGTGIGLALVRGLADAMGAQVSARNHPEGGLEVELRLSGAGEGTPPDTAS